MPKPDHDLLTQIVAQIEREGYTATELSKRTGITRMSVHKIITLDANPTAANLTKLADAIGYRWKLDKK